MCALLGPCASQGRESLSAEKEKNIGDRARDVEMRASYFLGPWWLSSQCLTSVFLLLSLPGVAELYFLHLGSVKYPYIFLVNTTICLRVVKRSCFLQSKYMPDQERSSINCENHHQPIPSKHPKSLFLPFLEITFVATVPAVYTPKFWRKEYSNFYLLVCITCNQIFCGLKVLFLK